MKDHPLGWRPSANLQQSTVNRGEWPIVGAFITDCGCRFSCPLAAHAPIQMDVVLDDLIALTEKLRNSDRPRIKGHSVIPARAPPELSRNVLRPVRGPVGPCSIRSCLSWQTLVASAVCGAWLPWLWRCAQLLGQAHVTFPFFFGRGLPRGFPRSTGLGLRGTEAVCAMCWPVPPVMNGPTEDRPPGHA